MTLWKHRLRAGGMRFRAAPLGAALVAACLLMPARAQLPTLGDPSDMAVNAERKLGERVARELYRVMPMGGAVVVVGEASASAEGRGAGVLAPFGTGGGAENREPLRAWQSYSWRPSASPFGPVTIVMSLSDQHVVVVRNGVEIGRARASIPVDVRSPGLLERTDAAQWVRVAGRESAATPDTNIVERVRMIGGKGSESGGERQTGGRCINCTAAAASIGAE